MSLKKQYLFIKKLESLYRTNRSLAITIDRLAKTEKNASLRRAFKEISDDLQSGSSLYQALEGANVLDEVYCKLIYVGETSGKLDSVFNHILQLIDNLLKVRRKIIAASLYPLGLLLTFYFIAHIIFLVVIPQLTCFFAKFNMRPPIFLIMVTSVVNPFNCCCVAPIGYLLLAVVIYILKNIDEISFVRGKLLMFIPGFGHLDRLKNLFSYIYTMKICYEAGMSVFESAELAAYNVSNEYIAQKFDEVALDIKNGSVISDALSKTGFFNFDMIDIIRVGEESGTLEESYTEVIKIIDEKINATIAIMTALIKPLGMLFGFMMLIVFFVGLGLLIFTILKSALPY